MISKLVVFAIILLGYIFIQHGSNGDAVTFGGEPNVTGLIPNISTSQKTLLYDKEINLFLSAYQRPINSTHRETLKVLKGSIDVNSTDRCIAMGYTFNLWGELPINNTQATGNGGCDALWGKECSENIRLALTQSLGNISSTACGVDSLSIMDRAVPGCPKIPNYSPIRFIASVALLSNDSFALSGISPTDPTKSWAYYQSDPSIDGDYDRLMKEFVFTYFVGRPYYSGAIDTAIACLSVYNKTDGTNPGNMSIQLSAPAHYMMLLWLFVIFI
jgi:hypothetical protein